jgi:hypothetical protein
MESDTHHKQIKNLHTPKFVTFNKANQFTLQDEDKQRNMAPIEKMYFSQKITKSHLKSKSDFPVSLRQSRKIKLKNTKVQADDNPLSDMKYKEDHVDQLKSLKDTLRSLDQVPKTTHKLFSPSSKRNNSLGFTFNHVPNLHYDSEFSSDSFNANFSRTPNPKYQRFKNTLLKTFDIEKHLDNAQEIERFHKIIEHSEYLEGIDKLPKISTIFNQEKIKNVEIKSKSNKIMGERYNPMNFYHNQSKSTTRRNIYGALFQH